MFYTNLVFRLFVLLQFAFAILVEAYYRFRARVPGQRLERRHEGLRALVALRILLVTRMAALLTFVTRPSWLDWSALPFPWWVRVMGMVASIGATATMIWVFHSLGKNLTDTVAAREQATLVTRGPYRHVRHPLYLSFALAAAAETLLTANWFVAVIGGLILALLAARTKVEESRLTEKFGDDYRAYCQRTPRFFPLVIRRHTATTSNPADTRPMTPVEPIRSTSGGCAGETLGYQWAKENRRRFFASPYNMWENLDWLKNFFVGPSRRYAQQSSFLPRESQLNEVEPRLRVAFVGDVMPTFGRTFQIGGGLRDFLQVADYLVLNLEGVISEDRSVWNSLRHDSSIIPLLLDLFPPEQTVISCANNHAADCGWRELLRCIALLRDQGFAVIGRRDCPVANLGRHVELACCTFWSNQRVEYLSRIEDARAASDRTKAFRVLYPHWGYELHLYPAPRQQSLGEELLSDWDAVIGHHSHCPQPIVRHADQLLAYSLGNFLFGINHRRYHHGLIVRMEIGPGTSGKWQAGKVAWRFTHQRRTGKRSYEIDLTDACPLLGE